MGILSVDWLIPRDMLGVEWLYDFRVLSTNESCIMYKEVGLWKRGTDHLQCRLWK